MKAVEMTSLAISDDVVAAHWLKRRVEAMSDLPVMWSRSAYTNRRTTHIAFRNGEIAVEAQPVARGGEDVLEVAEATLLAIRSYRATIDGDVGLVWRCEPEVTREDDGLVRIYTRLCFESDIIA